MAALRILLLLTLLVLPYPASAQTINAIGTVMEVEGTALITHDGKKSAAAVDTPVYMNDQVETGAGSKIHILFADETELTLADNAALTVDAYVFDEESGSGGRGRYSVLRGAFLFTSGLMTKAQNPDVEINTTYGAIGLRGTTVWGGDINDEYNVFVQDGEVSVTTNRGRIRMAAGEGTSIRSRDAIPALPKKWGQEKIGMAERMVALKNREIVHQRIAAHKARRAESLQIRKEKILDRQDMKKEIQENRRDLKMPENAQPPERKKQETHEKLLENREKLQQRRQEYQQKRVNLPPADGTARGEEVREKHMLGKPPRQNNGR